MAGRYLENSQRFDLDKLTRMVTRVPEIDFEIKNGRVSEWQALETYIFEVMKV